MSTQQQQDAEMCQPIETACQSGLQKLPLELVYHIIRLAASTDSKTAHACAYVSKEVCGWTAPDRWKTVICTSVRQLQVLHSILLSHEIQGRRLLTLPSRAPGHFVEHLFIDTQGSRCDVFEHTLQPGQDANGAQMGTAPHGADSPQQLPSPIRENMVFQVLGSCLHANYVALGPDELYNLKTACPYIPAKKKMITSDDEDPGHCLESLEGLQALHVISVNRDSEVTGAPMPIRELEALRSGSVAETGLMRTTAVSRFLPPTAGQDDRRDMANRATIRASLEEYERQNERNQALADPGIVRAEQDPFRNPYGQITTQQQELSHGRVGAEGLDELEHLTNVVASHINNPDPETPSGIKSDFKPTGMPLSADEQLALEFVPPKDRLRLGGMYVPYTKEQRLKWFLDNLYTDEA
ncbi:hypothetical protein NDA11_006950 [Ustilago hordei]|uniref:Uncharacterized protein n=1 Tax=Ustilago hordei TaxID=120017 RepID=I2FQR7_USTHO|nr:uncharacterized protein UHO2_05167 [Ustilago hordei]KAJ1042963.1 hypothetical protein NDA10_006055 [Ustilago hordei]KAJ1571209.1 hypothetical protein NDA12_002705 [Ustilago hordei]KAJ1571402.1 hypothetical protein NDA15_001027 [Ustilago hordei]KAJ1596155.1 hypothetical protein NDA11_006950 [Ustilago hordei]KAJ1596577.1 hypothetical protein NDA14_000870 [Ustilago hordei]